MPRISGIPLAWYSRDFPAFGAKRTRYVAKMETCTIENADPGIIPSPIQPLIKEFLNSPYTLLTERRNEILELQKKYQIRTIIDATDHSFRFGAKAEKAVIRVGLSAIERVWCYCFGIPKLYDSLRLKGAGKAIETAKSPELVPARRILDAALQSEKKKERIAWDCDLLCPSHNSDDADVQKANKILISVASFLLLHEIAHIVLAHPTEIYVSPNDKYQQEFDADLWAMEFTIAKSQEKAASIEHFIARANGIALGLSLLSSVELGYQAGGASDHPSIPERLLRFFDRYIPDNDNSKAQLWEQPKYFAATTLFGFLLNDKIDIDVAKTYPNLLDPIIDVRTFFRG